VLIATPRCVVPARCGVFADEQRVVLGDDGGRLYRRASTAGRVVRCGRPVGVPPNASRFPPFDPARGAGAQTDSSYTGALIATFRRAAPARCGAFADQRGVVATTWAGGPPATPTVIAAAVFIIAIADPSSPWA
jgi:hypothetical protein